MASAGAREADARTFMEVSADPVERAPAETTAMASTAPVRATTPVATADGLGLPSLSSAVAVDPPLAPSAACAEDGIEQLAAPLGDLSPREGGRRFDRCLVGDASAALISWVSAGVSPLSLASVVDPSTRRLDFERRVVVGGCRWRVRREMVRGHELGRCAGPCFNAHCYLSEQSHGGRVGVHL